MQSFKIIVERHKEGYVVYSFDLKCVVVGEGNTYEDAVADAISAINFTVKHLKRKHTSKHEFYGTNCTLIESAPF